MRIQIRGKNKKVSRNEFRYAVEWMLSMMMSKKLMSNLHIIIEFLQEKGLNGSTECLDVEYKPRSFKVRVDPNLSRNHQLKTLAHELVHVKQFSMCEMRYTKDHEMIKWHKQSINSDEMEYWDYPWEVEALGREYGIYLRYRKHILRNRLQFKDDRNFR